MAISSVESTQRWRANHPDAYAQQATKNRDRQRQVAAMVRELKDAPCEDCGVQYPPWVLDWDHRPGEKKLFNIAAASARNTEVVLAEIAKCDLVCANCHRQRTYLRGHLG